MATRLQRPGDQSPFILRTRSEVRKRLSADGSERRSRAPRRGGGAAHTQRRGAAPGGVGPGRPARPVCCAHGPGRFCRSSRAAAAARARGEAAPRHLADGPHCPARAPSQSAACLVAAGGRVPPRLRTNTPGLARLPPPPAPNVSSPDRQPGRACAPRPLKAESGGSEMQRREDSRCNG